MRRFGIAAMIAALTITLTACSGAAPQDVTSSGGPASAPAEFPRTIEVPAGPAGPATTLEIPAEPQRIATLSYETTALVTELGLADRIVLMPSEAANPVLTDHAAELADVPATIQSASHIDPEAVIAAAPDLVLMTARHGVEDTAGAAITAAGIPVLVLPNTWSTVDGITDDALLVGKATGAEHEADELVTDLAAGFTSAPVSDSAPRVLVLSNQAGKPFVTSGTAFPLEVLSMAGAADASAVLGLRSTGPITAEQVVLANPDAILLVDMNGSGDTMFRELLSNPAVAALPGAAHQYVVAGKQVQGLGLRSVVTGLEDLTAWVASLKQ